jgi:hypothetical protein
MTIVWDDETAAVAPVGLRDRDAGMVGFRERGLATSSHLVLVQEG